ncbi:hypothetical protein MRX96_052020 [Rhipicephalus microplus]
MFAATACRGVKYAGKRGALRCAAGRIVTCGKPRARAFRTSAEDTERRAISCGSIRGLRAGEIYESQSSSPNPFTKLTLFIARDEAASVTLRSSCAPLCGVIRRPLATLAPMCVMVACPAHAAVEHDIDLVCLRSLTVVTTASPGPGGSGANNFEPPEKVVNPGESLSIP